MFGFRHKYFQRQIKKFLISAKLFLASTNEMTGAFNSLGEM